MCLRGYEVTYRRADGTIGRYVGWTHDVFEIAGIEEREARFLRDVGAGRVLLAVSWLEDSAWA